MDKVGILIIDNDAESFAALRQVLGSEEWNIGVARDTTQALQELATGNWTLVVANVATTGVSGALYSTLQELAFSLAEESGKPRLRVLFVVPESDAARIQPVLERDRMPYTLKPFHFHDFLEKVSDLLMETESIARPIRRVRQEAKAPLERHIGFHSTGQVSSAARRARETGMFANREDYPMTEEDISEFERQESEETARKKKKKQETQLG
jgi:DNA-binding NtrC family response regulator